MEVNETARKYDFPERYTYADYEKWDDDIRYELIDGKAYMMSAPSVEHQRIITKLLRQLANFLDGKPCEVFVSPFDVCLYGKGDNDDTVVQPDILVVCDASKLDKKRLNGTPDMAIEIISPTTSRHDRITKLSRYQRAGVREYWIVDPDYKDVAVHILENGKYVINTYEDTETISVTILDGCEIVLPEIFSS